MLRIEYISNLEDNTREEVYADSLIDYRATVNKIIEIQNIYRYIQGPDRKMVSNITTNLSPEYVYIHDDDKIEIIKEMTYKRRNNGWLIRESAFEPDYLNFKELTIHERFIQVTSGDKERYLKIAKVLMQGACVTNTPAGMRVRPMSAIRAVVRGQTFLLKDCMTDEPLDSGFCEGEPNPFELSKIYSKVYIPVKEYEDYRAMASEAINAKRLSIDELKYLFKNVR